MDKINPNASGDETATSAAALAAKEAEAIYHAVFTAIHRLRGWTSESDLDRQLSNGPLALIGRLLMNGQDASLSIWANGIEYWSECERAPDWHPLRAFVDKWRAEFRAFYETLAGGTDNTLVLVGRWVDFFGCEPSTLLVYVQHIVSEEGVWSGPYTSGLAACDPALGGPGFPMMLPGQDAKSDRATLQRHARQRVLAENRRLGYADEPVVEGVFWWSKDLSRADYNSIVTHVSDVSVVI